MEGASRKPKPMKKKRFTKHSFGNYIASRTQLFQRGGFDVVFVCLVLILFTFGTIMLGSASYAHSSYYEGEAFIIVGKQIVLSLVGFALMIIMSKVDYRIFNGVLAWVGFFGTIVVMAGTILIGIIKGSATYRWLAIGPIRLQPSEFAKITLIIILAYLMTVMKEGFLSPDGMKNIADQNSDRLLKSEVKLFKKLKCPFLCCVLLLAVVVVYCVLVICQKHLSATILIFLMGYVMAMLTGADKKYFLILAGMGAVAVIIVVMNPKLINGIGFGASRITVWLDKNNPEYTDLRRQTVNGLYAIGSGGFFGVGFGRSVQKQLYISELHNDFVFPILCEELGFVGAVAMLLLFAALIYRGFKIAKESKDYFGSLLVMGIMIQIALQVIINIAVVTDLFPNTGMVLPFFSYGGSSIIAILCEMGIVISVSRRSRIEKI